MSKDKLTYISLEYDLRQKVDIDVEVEDIIFAVNQLPLTKKWNVCASIISNIDLREDLTDEDNFLTTEQKQIIHKWLVSKIELFK